MEKQQNNAAASKRRTRNLIMVTSLSAVVLIASTYAWFTGLQSVSVEPFQVEISSADSLELSLNGQQWSDTLTLTKDNILNTEADLGTDKINQKAYATNTNNWPVNTKVGTTDAAIGLVPLSSVGEMDTDISRMKLYEKSSMTTTDGGYRLLASQVDNDQTAENQKQKGYVAFDLFIKNYSGTQYLTNTADAEDTSFEEAIYLNTDSKVEVSTNAGTQGVAASGIENSVRVAFAQIGRISAYSSNGAATAITCENAGSGDDEITGLCRKAQIWEPNDTSHKQTALNWYDKSCLKRTGAGLNSYSVPANGIVTEAEKCGAVAEDVYLPTYAIAQKIEVGDTEKVDVYDGKEYNTYEGNGTGGTAADPFSAYTAFMQNGTISSKLMKYKYFTDTDKLKKGMERPTFMTLAPNSITKVRVYIYIEGQDIDNFDYAQVGKYISVGFGFSKQRYTAEEIIDTEADQELYSNLPDSVKENN